MISKNLLIPSSEMSVKLRRSRTEDGLLSSRDEKSQLQISREDKSRDSAFFSLNNTSVCLSPELRQPEEKPRRETSSVYQEQSVTNDLPKPLYLEVSSTPLKRPDELPQVPTAPPTIKVNRGWVWTELQESLANETSRC